MSNNSKINPDNDNFSFVDAEHNVLSFWDENQIFEKSLAQTSDQEPYIFYDGPPFATGLPHHGHLVGSILKDVVPRYFTMQGRYVQRRFGWDCHGVPIEHEIDKTLGMSSSEAVQKLGIRAYNGECRNIVQRYTQQWQKTITRIGRWVDFDNDYKTMEPWYMESVWWVFNQLWEKGLIYRGEKIVPFSTALGTVLSNFEAGSNYQDTQDPSITVLFKLKDEDTYIAAWTTTPWTLPANLALCVGDHIEYTKIFDEESEKHIIVATKRLETLPANKSYRVVSSFSGRVLVGKQYESLFPYFESKRDQGAFQIVSDDYVSIESGTGIVHQAPAFGEDDFRILNAAGISAMVCPIDMDGRFTEEVPDFSGLHVKDADKQIIRHLKQSGRLYVQDVIVHSYPFCPRSDTPLIYRSIDSWYVRVEQMRDQLIEVNQNINWVPDHIQNGRMGNWLAGSRDWAVSRNRYWGTPLPVWVNDESGKYQCIGSIAELETRTGEKITDLHRENIDHLTFKVEGDPGTYRRIEEVLDCWFESGSMPYAHLHYPFENKALFEKGFPAEFIAEGLDQTRGWFYTLIVLGNALFDTNAFNNVIVNGIVEAEDGKKMSKRLQNYTPPDDLMEQYGADALRLYLINSGLVKAEEQRFSDSGVKDMTRRALLPWLNAYRFLKTYATIDDWTPPTEPLQSPNIMDQWILSRLQSLKTRIAEEMSRYHLYNVVPALFDFIEDLTNWYIRLNRARFWEAHLSQDKQNAFQTLHTALYELSLCMAPFTPFLSETIFAGLPKQDNALESVHLCKYPVADSALIEPLLEQAVERMQHLILLGRQKRNQEKIKTKYPLKKLVIIHKDPALLDEISRLESYIQAELNVKQIAYHDAEENYINLFARPNSPVLGKRLGKEFKYFKALIDQLDSKTIVDLQETGSVILDGTTFAADDILVYRQAKPGTNAVSDRYISIDLDCSLDDDLIQEGLAREVVSRIQKSRKDSGLNVIDRIDLSIQTDSIVKQAVSAHLDYIKSETLCTVLVFIDDPGEGQLTYAIDQHVLGLTVAKSS